MWLLLNSAGRCSAMLDHTGVEVRAERGAAEAACTRPAASSAVGACHQIIRSASARSAADVVGAAHGDVLGRQLLEQLLDLGRQPGPVAVAERPGEPEHRPRGVADDLVELACLAHRLIVPVAGDAASTCSAAACADAMQAGMPTPSNAAPQTASPGPRPPPPGPARPARGARRRTAAAPPPQRVTSASTGSPVMPSSARRSRADQRHQLRVVALQDVLLAAPADRRTQQRQAARVDRPLLARQRHAP